MDIFALRCLLVKANGMPTPGNKVEVLCILLKSQRKEVRQDLMIPWDTNCY